MSRIAEGFGVRAIDLDGTSFEEIYAKVPALIAGIRAGKGPVLIEARVARLEPHSSSDDHRKYRSESDLRSLAELDPVLKLESHLLETRALSRSEVEKIRQEVKAEVDAAADWADTQPEPDGRDLLAHIFAEARAESPGPPHYISQEPVAVIDAINHGLREELARNPLHRSARRGIHLSQRTKDESRRHRA